MPIDILYLLVGFMFLSNALEAIIIPGNETVPAVLLFGDSVVDPGNNNHLNTIIQCNFPPYGRDFKGGIATGRFSNGKIPSDFIAAIFGVKELLPAFLDPDLTPEELGTGVSFATGGSGYDPLTPQIASVLTLTEQLDLLRIYLQNISSNFGEEKRQTILSKGIYIICAGSDDIANTYNRTPFRSTVYDVDSYIDLMLDEASSFYKELYLLGARRIGVVSIPIIGCVPSQRTLSGGVDRECASNENIAAQLFNKKLIAKLVTLNTQLPDSKFVYLDSYTALNSIIKSTNYGFIEATRGCCGTGIIEVSLLCTSMLDSVTCKNSSDFVFWDSYHPTEKAAQLLISLIFTQSVVDKFF